MDDVIIPPATSSTTGFLASGGHRGHGDHGGNHDWPSRTAERVKDILALNATERSEQTRDILSAINSSGAANSLATEKTGAAGILATNVAAGALAVSIQATSAATNLAIEKTAAAGLLEAVKNAAAAQLVVEKTAAAAALLAVQNQAAALAQAAQCCCELKEAIGFDGQKTRDLINSIQATNLATQLVDAKNEILVLRAGVGVAA